MKNITSRPELEEQFSSEIAANGGEAGDEIVEELGYVDI